jgi:hypothetical protein
VEVEARLRIMIGECPHGFGLCALSPVERERERERERDRKGTDVSVNDYEMNEGYSRCQKCK